jgi:hypothetical protein
MATKTPQEIGLEVFKRESRVYVHDACGKETEISGIDFYELCDPYDITLATRCAHCGIVSLQSVSWKDTGETVSAYRERVRRATELVLGHSPLVLSTFCALAVPVVLLVVLWLAGIFDRPSERAMMFAVYGIMSAIGLPVGFLFGLKLTTMAKQSAFLRFCMKNSIGASDIV